MTTATGYFLRSRASSLLLTAFVLCFSMLIAQRSNAQIPRQFSYQGIAQKNGVNVTNTHTVQISLSNASHIVVYTETQSVMFGPGGEFNIIVGQPNGLPTNLNLSQPLALRLSIDSIELSSVPLLGSTTSLVSASVVDGAIDLRAINASGSAGALVSDGHALSWQTLSGSGGSSYPVQGSLVPFSDAYPRAGYTFLGTANTFGDKWSTLTPSNTTPFFTSAVAQVGTTLYVMGQSQPDMTAYVAGVQKISLPSGLASAGANLPSQLGASGVAVWGNNIYVIGGAIAPTGPNTVVPTVFVYNTTDNTTRTSSSTGWTGVAYPAAVTVGNNIWVLGGFNGTADVPTISMFNPATETWSSTQSSLSVAVDGAYYGTDGKSIYVLGGATRSSKTLSSAIQTIDIATGNVTVQNSAFPASAFGASVTHNGKIYMFGGVDSNNVNLSRVLIYDMTLHTLTAGNSMASRRQLPAVGILDNTFYLFGGLGTTSTLADGQSYVPPISVNWFLKN